MNIMINCTKCGEYKDTNCFRPRRWLKRGFHSWCKDCEKVGNKLRYELNYIPKPKIVKEINPDEVKLEAKKRMLKYRYKLDYNNYLLLYEQQDRKCKICNVEKELGTVNGLLVDHCHTTNKVRGLLCSNCNSGLGKFMENYDIIIKASQYIKDNL
jgi:hypothetical protein